MVFTRKLQTNILIDNTGHVRLSDYDLIDILIDMRWIKNTVANNHMTDRYRWQAPEMLSAMAVKNGTDKNTEATDVYAFSICAIEVSHLSLQDEK